MSHVSFVIKCLKIPDMILATLCYVKHNGKTLMVHRNKKPNDIHEGKWNGLGGKFEAGETPERCVRREVQEEAGLVHFAQIGKGEGQVFLCRQGVGMSGAQGAPAVFEDAAEPPRGFIGFPQLEKRGGQGIAIVLERL